MSSAPEIQDDDARYGATAQLLHWATALLIVGAFAVGFYMVGLERSPLKLKLFAYHKWVGVTVFALLLLRGPWRLAHPAPALPMAMPAWQRSVAHATHLLLYLLIAAVPLSGWLMSSAKGFQTVWFGVLPLPNLLDKNPELGEWLEDLHWLLNKTLLALVTLHVVAALKHWLLDRDRVLQRMLPARRRS